MGGALLSFLARASEYAKWQPEDERAIRQAHIIASTIAARLDKGQALAGPLPQETCTGPAHKHRPGAKFCGQDGKRVRPAAPAAP